MAMTKTKARRPATGYRVARRVLCPIGGASIVPPEEVNLPVAAVPPTRRARLPRALTFVAIVWSIAGTFVLFEHLALLGFDALESSPGVTGDTMVSSATVDSTSCNTATAADDPQRAPNDLSTREVQAWQLGLAVGFDAVARQRAGMAAGTLQQSRRDIDERAAILHVPAPSSFVPEHLVKAPVEFVPFVEEGTAATAGQLAATYSSAACRYFKLGAYWGYSAVIRPVLKQQRATHAPEIRYYAQKTDLPPALWQPMVEPSPDRDSAELATGTSTLTEAVTRYLAMR
jgi:hypothetical protein